MHLRNRLTVLTLFLLGGLLAAANVWFAAARSTIPLSLDGKIRAKERRAEKHLGIDDVYLLDLGANGMVQVDRHVFDNVNEGETIHKERWARELRHGADVLPLTWSNDVRGLIITMLVALAVLLATIVLAEKTMRAINRLI